MTIEVVLVGVPVAVGPVWVGIDDSDTREAGGCLDCGKSYRIADELSVIVLYEWCADKVCSWGKVDKSWGYGTGVAALTAAVAISDSSVNCCSVVCGAVSSCAIVLDITEDLVRRVAECNSTLPLDVGNPVR